VDAVHDNPHNLGLDHLDVANLRVEGCELSRELPPCYAVSLERALGRLHLQPPDV
jgi:hypothetical protein